MLDLDAVDRIRIVGNLCRAQQGVQMVGNAGERGGHGRHVTRYCAAPAGMV